MPGFNLQWLAQLSAERMLNGALAGAGIALFAWVLLRLIGKQNSGTRFAVWFSALLAIAFVPLSGLFASTAVAVASRAEFTISSAWAAYLFAAWAAIASIGLVRVGIGLWQLRRLRKSSVPVKISELDETLQRTLREFEGPRKVTLCTSASLKMPTAVGFFRPLVVIPEWAMKELSTQELNSILLHELAHLRRWDDCTNLAQKILGALLFFHPAVWWIERKLTLEREMACDDLVLERTENPRAYAECLVSLAEKGFLRRGLALAQAAIGRMRDTTLRIRQILDGGRPRATRVWMPALLLVSGFAFTFTLVQSRLPRLVSFEGGSASPRVETANADTPALGFPEARVVPAKLTTEPVPTNLKPATNRVVRAHKAISNPTKMVPREEFASLVRTAGEQQQMMTPAIYVVMETQQFEGPNATRWTFCVWRVTVVAPPAQKRIDSGIVAKST
jgi:beta-lactamase regulating signal transducer with metallopeptidase domain